MKRYEKWEGMIGDEKIWEMRRYDKKWKDMRGDGKIWEKRYENIWEEMKI